MGVMLYCYIIAQCIIPYKNPNSSKSKKYKLGIRVSFILIFINPLSFNTSLALKTERVDIPECLDSVETATEKVVWAHLPA